MRNIVIGAIILVTAFLFREKLVASAPELFYYAVLIAGLALVIIGLMGFLRARAESEDMAPQKAKRTLAHEVLLSALCRMSYADTNIDPSEVEAIQKIYKETTGESISAGDVRVAARADIYEERSFEKYLAGARGSLSDDDKKMIMTALAAVIRADGNVSPFEVGFFNEVCEALKVPAACLSDLESDEADPETVVAKKIPQEMLGEKPPPPPADPDQAAAGDETDDEPATLKIEDEPDTEPATLKIEDEPDAEPAEGETDDEPATLKIEDEPDTIPAKGEPEDAPEEDGPKS